MSSDKKQMLADLIDKYTMLGKIANNTELHGQNHATGFTVPFDELPLEPAELCVIFGDKYFDRSVFNKTAKSHMPCAWLAACEPLKLRETYHEAVVLMTVSGDRELEFDEVLLKDLIVTFDPKYGAVGILSGKMYLHPGLGKENLLLQEHQHRRVMVTITNATVMLKAKSKQVDAFEGGEEGEQAEGGDDTDKEGEAPPVTKAKRGRKRANGSRPGAH